MSASAIPHNYVPVVALRQVLSDDITLAAMPVTPFDGTPRLLQKNSDGEIFNRAIPQDDDAAGAGPSIVLGPPIAHDLAARKNPYGDNLVAADFIIDVWIHMHDVEPDNLGLNKMLGWIIRLLEGSRIPVDGGEAFTITIHDYPTPQRVDKGTYIFTAVGVSFLVAAQVD
jgi:hypothetical protein